MPLDALQTLSVTIRFASGASLETKNYILASLGLDGDASRCQIVLKRRLDDLRQVHCQIDDVL
jgi:hypothetical protein